jgi:hypothetical protein
MKYIATSLLIAVLPLGHYTVQATEIEDPPFECCETDPPGGYQNNLAALSTGENSVEINSESTTTAVGTRDGEITVFRSDAGVEVFSGPLKVETIIRGSDGWTGSVLLESSSEVRYKPDGRPELVCAAQSIANWFGPCKVPEPA